jgi:hypothetical protein
MPFFAFRTIACVAVAASHLPSLTSAHMFMASPKPIEGSALKDPLHLDGSNFPCHGVSLSGVAHQRMEAGSSFRLQFDLGANGENTAVHGGGSCQLAVTYETSTDRVRDPSNWHVIYSIEGGCPSNSAGNLRNSTYCTSPGQDECVHTWNVPLPKGLQSGQAVMSWTWFNAVGDREMYQNCAKVEITGGTGEEMGSFPPIYVANIGSGDVCTAAPEQTNLAFHDPGQHRTMMSATKGKNWPYATATCSFGGFTQTTIQASQSNSYAALAGSDTALVSSSSVWSNGLPGSDALHRLATAAIVSAPTSSAIGDPVALSEDGISATLTNTWSNDLVTNGANQHDSISSNSRGAPAYHSDSDVTNISGLHTLEIASTRSAHSPC